MFNYTAKVIRWLDGDTVELDVDLGFLTHHHPHIRMIGIYAPEMRYMGGPAAKAAAEAIAPPGSTVWLDSRKPVLIPAQLGRSITRWLGHIRLPMHTRTIAETLLEQGHGTTHPT